MDPWKQLTEHQAYDGYRKVVRRRYLLPTHVEADFDIVIGDNFVCTLALTPDNQVVIARQFRPGPGKVLLELPGGGVNPDEEPEKAAARELLEETGFAGNLHLVTSSWHGAYNNQRRYNFVATECVRVQEPENNPYEPIEVLTIDLPRFIRHLESGELTDTTTGYAGLHYLGLL